MKRVQRTCKYFEKLMAICDCHIVMTIEDFHFPHVKNFVLNTLAKL